MLIITKNTAWPDAAHDYYSFSTGKGKVSMDTFIWLALCFAFSRSSEKVKLMFFVLYTFYTHFIHILYALKIGFNVNGFKQKKTKFCKWGEPSRHVCCEHVFLYILDETEFQRKQTMT